MRLAPSAVQISHRIASQLVSTGDKVIDATAGNGHDTVYLAQLVGSSGHVYAFDIQEEAIAATKEKLLLANLESRVSLFNDGHQNLEQYVKSPVKLAMFNLGYLPGGVKNIITLPETTLEAVRKSLNLLQLFGAVLLTIYTGHPGGQEEWDFIKQYVCNLPSEQYDVMVYQYLNRNVRHPFTVLIQKIAN